MPEKCSAHHIESWRLLLETNSHLADALDRELTAKVGLPLTWHEVLAHLSPAPDGAMRMSDLADSVLLSKSGLTRLVDRMVGAGLIERRTCDSDRRGYLAAITEQGRHSFKESMPVFAKSLTAYFARYLSESEAKTLLELLGKVRGRESVGSKA